MANYKEIIRDTTVSFRIETTHKDELQKIVRRDGYKSLSALMEEIVLEYLSKQK